MLKDVLLNRFTAKHWESKEVEQSKIDYILDCAYLAPSKIAARSHKIVVLTESSEAKKIKDWLYYKHTHNTKGIKELHGEDTSLKKFNGQYNAPLILAWLNPINFPERAERIREGIKSYVKLPDIAERQDDICISSMCAMAAAEEQGLNTGFGSCHNPEKVAKKLGFSDYECPIVVGIGYARDTTEEESKHGFIIPISDNKDKVIGFDIANITADNDTALNRGYTPSQQSTIVTI
jgi:nitroreductase